MHEKTKWGIIFLLQPSPRKSPAFANGSKSNILTLYIPIQIYESLKKMKCILFNVTNTSFHIITQNKPQTIPNKTQLQI